MTAKIDLQAELVLDLESKEVKGVGAIVKRCRL
jgi:hypothetical protein